MKYLSVCSGIEAATVAWHGLGWFPWAFSEIEKFPSAVLKHHYPDIPNLGDMTKFKEWPDANIDVLVGGTPCQSFSVAGLRKGLDDPRGNLMLTFGAIAGRYRPRWLVWENVPGVLSSNGGKDFGTFLGMLAELGYGFAYRVLDAQFFGVPQRRRRVFVVGHLGDWRCAATVLFERHSLQGHTAPSRKAGERVAPTVASGPPFSRTGNERVECEAMVAVGVDEECNASVEQFGPLLRGGQGGTRQTVAICMETGQANAGIGIGTTLNCNHEAPIVAQATAIRTANTKANGHGISENMAHTLDRTNGQCVAFGWNKSASQTLRVEDTTDALQGSPTSNPGLLHKSIVRRLTPRECERLQGFTTMIKRAIITVCLDHQKNSALVEITCLKLRSNVLPVDENARNEFASYADMILWNDPESQESLVALHVRRSHEMRVRAIRSQGKLILFANGAEQQSSYHQFTQSEDFARALVLISQGLEASTITGKVESPQSIKVFFHQENGNKYAVMFGQENEASAKDANGTVTEAMKFIISNHGHAINHSGLTNQIWLSSALNVISSCIPKATPISNSFKLIIDIETDYTLIPWGNKDADSCPDGPRYKALGNSMAVPVMRWIGKRIQSVEQIIQKGI